MSEAPMIKLDPERLREERHDVDLGEQETQFDELTGTDNDDAKRVASVTETTAGILPPAR